MKIAFYTWGGWGLVYHLFVLFQLSGNVGVGTSAYYTMTAVIWIGGMLLLALGNACFQPDKTTARMVTPPPLPR